MCTLLKKNGRGSHGWRWLRGTPRHGLLGRRKRGGHGIGAVGNGGPPTRVVKALPDGEMPEGPEQGGGAQPTIGPGGDPNPWGGGLGPDPGPYMYIHI